MSPHRTISTEDGAWAGEVLPSGAGLQAMADLVHADLAPDEAVGDLVGEDDLPGGLRSFRRAGLPRIRPILVALAARASGATGVDAEAQHTAELLHLALVLHDHAVGREGGRRRRLARHVFRRSVSWLAGQRVSVRALELSRHSHPQVIAEVVDTLREFSVGHQLTERLRARRAAPEVQDWRDHADAHTGALFAFCCRAGAALAGADPPTVSALGRYGRHVGRLWHVAEDVSALRHGDAAEHLLARSLVGRPVLPVAEAVARSEEAGERWRALLDRPEPSLAADAAAAVEAAGGCRISALTMARESWAARRVVHQLPDSAYRAALDDLAAGLARAAVPARS